VVSTINYYLDGAASLASSRVSKGAWAGPGPAQVPPAHAPCTLASDAAHHLVNPVPHPPCRNLCGTAVSPALPTCLASSPQGLNLTVDTSSCLQADWRSAPGKQHKQQQQQHVSLAKVLLLCAAVAVLAAAAAGAAVQLLKRRRLPQAASAGRKQWQQEQQQGLLSLTVRTSCSMNGSDGALAAYSSTAAPLGVRRHARLAALLQQQAGMRSGRSSGGMVTAALPAQRLWEAPAALAHHLAKQQASGVVAAGEAMPVGTAGTAGTDPEAARLLPFPGASKPEQGMLDGSSRGSSTHSVGFWHSSGGGYRPPFNAMSCCVAADEIEVRARFPLSLPLQATLVCHAQPLAAASLPACPPPQFVWDSSGQPVILGEGFQALVCLGRLQGMEVAVKVGGAGGPSRAGEAWRRLWHAETLRMAACITSSSAEARSAPYTAPHPTPHTTPAGV